MTAPTRTKLNLKSHKTPKTPLDHDKPWRILVVDDDDQVHLMTDLLFQDFQFDNRPFVAVHAFTAAEAQDILTHDPHIPVALVDVVMERPDAGLALIRTIRNEMDNPAIRLILRTGQPGEAPERDVVLDYDINDYKAKTELTAQKLYTCLVTALRSWREIMRVAQLAEQYAEANLDLERRVKERTRDLTQALEQAGMAKRDLRQFLSMMSHEFRTPLAIIDSAAQMLLLRNDERRTATKPRLEAIRSGVDRLIGLIDTCLAEDRLETEALELRAVLADISPLIHAAVDQQKQAHPDRIIDLSLPALPPLRIDEGLLAMAVNNLLNNALKYSTDHIQVRVTARTDHVLLDIVDHGIGIPSGELAYIFDRFYRADNVKGMAGTGIGLHMSQRIVNLHGGTISAVSTENVGSTFTIRLPVPEAGASKSGATA